MTIVHHRDSHRNVAWHPIQGCAPASDRRRLAARRLELWGIMGNYGGIMVELWGSMGNYGELWWNYGEFGWNYGDLWGIMVELRGIRVELW